MDIHLSKTNWQILDIEPIRDKKSIKKAYAKKLKVTRPDADPEGFKRLNTAYQECLEYLDYDWYWEEYDEDEDDDWEEQADTFSDTESPEAQSDAEQSSVSAPVDYDIEEVTLNNVSDHMDESLKPAPVARASAISDTSNTSESQEETNTQPIAQPNDSEDIVTDTAESNDGYGTDLDDEFDMEALLKPFADARVHDEVYVDASETHQQFLSQLDDLFANPAKLNNIDTWHDLLQDDALYDISFKQHVSKDILGRIIDMRAVQITHAEENKTKLPPSFLSQPLLVKLSDFFGWMHNQERLENQFYYQYDALNQFFDDLEPDDAPVIAKEANREELEASQLGLAPLWKRAVAFFIDWFIIIVGGYYLGKLIDQLFGSGLSLFAMALVLSSTLIMQSQTRWQASIGMKLCGIRVVSLYNTTISYSRAFFRMLLALFVFMIFVASIFKVFGIVIWGAYFIEKYRSKSRYTWLDKQSKTYIVNR